MAFSNFGKTTLNGAILSSDTTIAVTSGADFPDGDFIVTIWPDGSDPTSANAELVHVGTNSANSFTGCTRGVEGTSGTGFADGDNVALTTTAAALNGDNAAQLIAGQVFS